jgi:uncharacterized protein (TIGR02145 family)
MKINSIFSVVMSTLFACQPTVQNEGVFDIGAINERLNDIKNYPQVTIGNQTWLATNLGVTKFRNGDTISYARTQEEWVFAADNNIPAWTYEGFSEPLDANMVGVKYYNWHAVNDNRGIAPDGWKVPSVNDWNILFRPYVMEPQKMLELFSNKRWELEDGATGNNASGFHSEPYGYCDEYSGFANLFHSACWWSSDEMNREFAWEISLHSGLDINIFESVKGYGLNIRLIKQHN